MEQLSHYKFEMRLLFRQRLKSCNVGFNLRVEFSEFQSLTVLKWKVLCPVAVLYKGMFSIWEFLVVRLVIVALWIYLENKDAGAQPDIHLKAIIAWQLKQLLSYR